MEEYPKAYLLIENKDGREYRLKGKVDSVQKAMRENISGTVFNIFVPGVTAGPTPAQGAEYEIIDPQALPPGQKMLPGSNGSVAESFNVGE